MRRSRWCTAEILGAGGKHWYVCGVQHMVKRDTNERYYRPPHGTICFVLQNNFAKRHSQICESSQNELRGRLEDRTYSAKLPRDEDEQRRRNSYGAGRTYRLNQTEYNADNHHNWRETEPLAKHRNMRETAQLTKHCNWRNTEPLAKHQFGSELDPLANENMNASRTEINLAQ